MEDEDGPVSPFWLRSNSISNKSRGRSLSVFLNSTFFMILFLVIALLFVVIIVPSILKFTSQIFKPQAVKKGWDSLNLVLVLFAIFCAFLSRNNHGETSSDQDQRNVVVSSPSRNQNQWYDHEYADRVGDHPLRKMRSRNSYPDLRLDPPWTTDGGRDDRFHDDTHFINHRVNHHQRRRSEGDFDVDNFTDKKVQVDTESRRSNKVFPTARPVRSPTPLTIEKLKSKRTYRTLAPEDKAMNSDLEMKKSQVLPVAPQATIHPKSRRTSNRTPAKEENTERTVNSSDLEQKKSQVAPIAPPSPPPPPPPPLPEAWSPEKKSDRKRGGATRDLFTLKRKKKQRQKSVENFDYFLSNSKSSLPEPPPPPPPRSTQSSSFQNLFSSKKKKHKLIYLSPPPPPPPPPAVSRPETSINTNKPPLLSEKTGRFGTIDGSTASGGESPSIIPPPPPLPPFKMPDWKFAVHGDYVRIKSIGSSCSDSPDMDDVESNLSAGEINGGDSPPPQPSMFCPSPDVDTKAGNFIARFRAGLKLEKTDSIKGIGLSKLGQEPGQNP